MDTNISFWQTTTNLNNTNAGEINNKKFDILIIGAGLAGINTAYLLANKGYNIGIIEASNIGYGVSSYSTAKITIQHNLIYDYLIRNFGLSVAKNYFNANQDGLEFYKNIVSNLNIDCDFELDKAVLYTTDSNNIYDLKNEQDAYKQLNIKSSLIDNYLLPFPIKAGLEIFNQYKFNPLKYLYIITKILLKNKIKIYENIRAIDIKQHKSPYEVLTSNGKIFADKIVVTTHFPFDKSLGRFYWKMSAEKSYVIAAKTNIKKFNGMYINIDKDIRSIRFQKYGDDNILLLCGCNHMVGMKKDEETCYNELEQYLIKYFSKYTVIKKWSTQDCMTHDKLPYIGTIDNHNNNIYVATGFNKWGMTTSALSSIIISNMILNNNEIYYDNIFNPNRHMNLNIDSVLDIGKTGIISFIGLVKRIFLNSHADINDLDKMTGKIIHSNGIKIGVFLDESNIFHCIKPTCSHLGCELKFNNTEKTWDCQCHGSRYNIYGEILEGPATKPLKYVRINKEELIRKNG